MDRDEAVGLSEAATAQRRGPSSWLDSAMVLSLTLCDSNARADLVVS
jgi:hypothetical protein